MLLAIPCTFESDLPYQRRDQLQLVVSVGVVFLFAVEFVDRTKLEEVLIGVLSINAVLGGDQFPLTVIVDELKLIEVGSKAIHIVDVAGSAKESEILHSLVNCFLNHFLVSDYNEAVCIGSLVKSPKLELSFHFHERNSEGIVDIEFAKVWIN